MVHPPFFRISGFHAGGCYRIKMYHAFRRKSPHPISGGAVSMARTIVELQDKSKFFFHP
jgi:hypothetical protein